MDWLRDVVCGARWAGQGSAHFACGRTCITLGPAGRPCQGEWCICVARHLRRSMASPAQHDMRDGFFCFCRRSDSLIPLSTILQYTDWCVVTVICAPGLCSAISGWSINYFAMPSGQSLEWTYFPRSDVVDEWREEPDGCHQAGDGARGIPGYRHAI